MVTVSLSITPFSFSSFLFSQTEKPLQWTKIFTTTPPLLRTTMSHHYPKLLLDTLHCLEDHIHWEEEKQREEDDDYISTTPEPNFSDVVLFEQDLFWDTHELSSLLAKENLNNPSISLLNNPSLASSRGEAVEWILKVNLHYSFSTLTALLAVNYLDRFLFTFRFQNDKPWLTQLVAVACLSLAAKVEETHVPLFVDLQVRLFISSIYIVLLLFLISVGSPILDFDQWF